MRQPEKKLLEDLNKAAIMSTADARSRRERMSHLEILREALQNECLCQGRAIPGWIEILTCNSFNVQVYRQSVFKLFQSGGGKGLNHLYIGEPNSGKTALTKPIVALFGTEAFLKPQVGTTFALQGLIGVKTMLWNEFRWPSLL